MVGIRSSFHYSNRQFYCWNDGGRKAGLSHKASTNIGLTLVSRGEFSIIVANIGIAGGLMAAIKPFSALYVLILASLGPLLTKESGENILY